MSRKLFGLLKDAEEASGVDPALREYEERFRDAGRGGPESVEADHERVNNLYYDLATDFYEFGWARSFHFAPRVPGESFKASLARHERHLADVLELKPGMVAADVGCGVGGPLMEIARHSGAKIVGINSNAYQLERARKLTEEAGLAHLADFLHCDFLNVDAPDNSFDAVFSIEATCCAPDKLSVYGEVFRLLKPGARFAAYEYCMTDRFDPNDPHHLKLKADIQFGGCLTVIDDRRDVDDALLQVGFEALETRDLAERTGPSIPLVSTACRIGPILCRLSQFIDRALRHPQLTARLGSAPHGAARNGPRIADPEPLRGCHSRGGPLGHLLAHVLHPRAQTGVGRHGRAGAPV